MKYIFDDDSIKLSDGSSRIVMHSWETPIMEKMANWVCSNGGDILEVGFGMGIASNFIQKHNIDSHTICEINPDVITNLKKWSSDKPNVKILEGDWFDNRDRLEKYDGILFDTFDIVSQSPPSLSLIRYKYLLKRLPSVSNVRRVQPFYVHEDISIACATANLMVSLQEAHLH